MKAVVRMNKLKVFSLLWLLFLLSPTTLTRSPFLTLNQLSISGLDLKNIRLFLLESSEHQTEISWSVGQLVSWSVGQWVSRASGCRRAI